MPGADRADVAAALLQGIEQRLELGARQAEYGVDTIDYQRIDDRHAAGHGCGLGLLHSPPVCGLGVDGLRAC